MSFANRDGGGRERSDARDAGTARTACRGRAGGRPAAPPVRPPPPGGAGARPRPAPPPRPPSIARSIARSNAAHLLLWFVFADILVALALLAGFVWQSHAQLPEEMRGAPVIGIGPDGTTALVGLSGTPSSIASFFGMIAYTVTAADGTQYVFDLSPVLAYATPALATLAVVELVIVYSSLVRTRAIRRKLKPLNDLALTAEAIGSATSMGKIDSLERAISSADVDSPTIETGDADLRSIEVALNGLLRRMQQAKLEQTRFVDDASHELRTPIAVIQGYVDMLDRWGKTDEEVLDESIAALKDESAHMKELVEQLLFLARGEAGRNTLTHEPLNLARVCREVWEESAMIDGDHRYLLAGEVADQGDARFAMVGDVAMIKQSMRIMVQNAAKYSPAGSSVTIGALPAEADEGGRPMVGYLVEDEGAGMSGADVGHAFERFWRSDEARASESGGSGLGLSIAKWIVDAHDGSIAVLSYEGVGTRFVVRLPTGLPTDPGAPAAPARGTANS